jgi:hypothetical protein
VGTPFTFRGPSRAKGVRPGARKTVARALTTAARLRAGVPTARTEPSVQLGALVLTVFSAAATSDLSGGVLARDPQPVRTATTDASTKIRITGK